jgi:hypothetical protein
VKQGAGASAAKTSIAAAARTTAHMLLPASAQRLFSGDVWAVASGRYKHVAGHGDGQAGLAGSASSGDLVGLGLRDSGHAGSGGDLLAAIGGGSTPSSPAAQRGPAVIGRAGGSEAAGGVDAAADEDEEDDGMADGGQLETLDVVLSASPAHGGAGGQVAGASGQRE